MLIMKVDVYDVLILHRYFFGTLQEVAIESTSMNFTYIPWNGLMSKWHMRAQLYPVLTSRHHEYRIFRSSAMTLAG